ncbi:MAG: trehalose-phosphatase [Candidatus Eisenbacteria bacterium]
MPRLKPLWLSLGALSHRLRTSEALFLAVDFDGTLTPIAEHPDQVRLPERARELLRRLTRRDGVHLAVISGRRLDDLERLLDGRRLFLAGAGGLETRDEDGRRRVHLPPDVQLPEPLHPELETWCRRFSGAWVEDKRFSYALHYRGVAPTLQPAFGAGVRRRARPYRGQIQLVHGKRVFEIMPAVAWEKSAALRLWLDERQAAGTLLFFGDDTSDEPVYTAVRERGGIAVAVGRTVSAAEFSLPSPAEVIWFLEWLDSEWGAREAPPKAPRESHSAAG